MQTRRPRLGYLRQKLIELHHPRQDELAPFLSDRPLVKGTVYTLRRKCSKTSCRCARGEHHETVVLTASIGGKTRLWTLREEEIEEISQRAEQYRQFRRARSRIMKDWAKRQAQMLRLIDEIEKIRIVQP